MCLWELKCFFSSKVVEKLCRYHGLWKEGKTQQIQQEISSTPKTKLPQFVKQETGRDGSDASDGGSGSEVEEETNRDVYCNGHHEVMISGQGKQKCVSALYNLSVKFIVGFCVLLLLYFF